MAKMKYDIKPIKTEYSGIIFRSRLEARWAAFFDILGWDWVYEPFDLDGWFPDFLLKPASECFPCHENNGIDYENEGVLVEVKPITKFCKDTANQLAKALLETNNNLEPLLVGLEPIFECPESHTDGAKIGWLAERCPEWDEDDSQELYYWETAPLRDFMERGISCQPDDKIIADFCHESGSYVDRLTNYYEGSTGYMSSNICRMYWGEACDKVKYQPKESD